MTARLYIGDVFERMADLEDGAYDVIITSPPFLALRSYLPDGHPDKAKEIGSEATPAAFLDVMLALTAEWGRLLAPHGSIAVEIGDTYAGSGGAGGDYGDGGIRDGQAKFGGSGRLARYGDQRGNPDGMRDQTFQGANTRTGGGDGWPLAKSLAMIPELYAASLAYGRNLLTGQPSPAGRWRIRNFKPWIRCLDIDTAVYVRTPTGDRPMRLLHLHQQFAPGKFEVWNGERWTPVVATQPALAVDALEIEFRTGERISCTRDHRWPVDAHGVGTKLLRADELAVGDVVPQVRLPEDDRVPDAEHLGDDVAWLAGVFLADGSFDSRDRIQVAGHKVNDVARAERLARIAASYDGTCSVYEHGNEDGGNRQNVVIRSQVLAAAIRRYIDGDNARNKRLSIYAWRRSDRWLLSLIEGYLISDGHFDAHNDRWRLGFTDNRWLARDLRTVAARLGASCIVRRWGPVPPDQRGGNWAGQASFRHRGEIRFGHRGTDGRSQPKARGEIVAIRAAKRRSFIDLAVADDPHLFALASGLLTHNSNPPVGALGDKERPATSYVTVATRATDRYFDLDAVRTAHVTDDATTRARVRGLKDDGYGGRASTNAASNPAGAPPLDWWHHVDATINAELDENPGANGTHIRRRLETAGILTTLDALDVSPKGYAGAHYAVWPPELVKQLLLEMAPRRVCTACGQPSRRITDVEYVESPGRPLRPDDSRRYGSIDGKRHNDHRATAHRTAGWSDCGCPDRPGCGTCTGYGIVPGDDCNCTAGSSTNYSECPHNPKPCPDCVTAHEANRWRPARILDPFAGSGTTLAVATGLGHTATGIDLDERNAQLARDRVGMFLEIIHPTREAIA